MPSTVDNHIYNVLNTTPTHGNYILHFAESSVRNLFTKCAESEVPLSFLVLFLAILLWALSKVCQLCCGGISEAWSRLRCFDWLQELSERAFNPLCTREVSLPRFAVLILTLSAHPL